MKSLSSNSHHYGFSAIMVAPATMMSPAMKCLRIPFSLRNVPERIIVNKIFKEIMAATKVTLPVLTALVPVNELPCAKSTGYQRLQQS